MIPVVMASIQCRKCDSKHPRPVGRNCKRTIPVTDVPSTSQTPVNAASNSGVTAIDIAAIASLVTAQMTEQISTVVQEQMAKHTQSLPSVSEQTVETSVAAHQQCTPALLRGDNIIQSAVNDRISQLEAATAQEFQTHGKTPSITKIKPGRERVPGHESVRQFIQWPHELVYVGPHLKHVKYDDLSQSQFSAGMMSMVLNESNNEIKQAILKYVTDLHHDMIDIGFPTTLAINSTVLSQLEEGKLTWLDCNQIDNIKKKFILNAALRASHLPTNSETSFNRTRVPSANNISSINPCSNYNLGKCASQWTHRDNNGVTLKHICSFCFSRGNSNTNHPEIQCRQKSTRPPPV